jgi:hypothetical protein
MPQHVTLLDLVSSIASCARTEDEVIATVVHLVNSGRVRLCGTFSGASFDLQRLGLIGRPRSIERRKNS